MSDPWSIDICRHWHANAVIMLLDTVYTGQRLPTMSILTVLSQELEILTIAYDAIHTSSACR